MPKNLLKDPSSGPQRKLVSLGWRDRDKLQVPLALAEAGALDRHITDYYSSETTILGRTLFSHRSSLPGLPDELVISSLRSAAWQTPLRVPILRRTRWATHGAIEHAYREQESIAAKRLRASDSGLLALHDFDLQAFRSEFPERPIISFQYHPHPSAYATMVFPRLGIDSIQTRDREYHRELRHPISRDSWCFADHILTASSFTKQSLIAAGCSAEKISVHPYGCFYADERIMKPIDSLEYLYVGQALSRKGLEYLNQSWIAARPPGATLRFVCSRIARNGMPVNLDPSIKVYGPQSRDSLRQFFERAHVFVLPSLMEGFGLVLGEALSAGCFCIATDATGMVDLDPDGVASIVVPLGDSVALSRALQDAADIVRSRQDMPETAMRLAERNSWEAFRASIGLLTRQLLRTA